MKEEGRSKKEEGRRKREEGRRKDCSVRNMKNKSHPLKPGGASTCFMLAMLLCNYDQALKFPE